MNGVFAMKKLILLLMSTIFLLMTGCGINSDPKETIIVGFDESPLGYRDDDVITPSEGDIISLYDDGRVHKVANVALHPQVVDGLGVGDVGPVVLSDRRVLGQSGIIIVLIKHYRDQKQAGRVRINKYGFALHDMIIISRGFVFMKEADDVVEFIQQRAGELLMEHHSEPRDRCERLIERGLGRSLYKIIQREPMIEVEIVDV